MNMEDGEVWFCGFLVGGSRVGSEEGSVCSSLEETSIQGAG